MTITKKERIKQRVILTRKLLKQNKFTRMQIMEEVHKQFPEFTKTAVSTFLHQNKNPKYAKDKNDLITMDKKTKILSMK